MSDAIDEVIEQTTEQPAEQFLYDDFFVPEDDAGVEVTIKLRGRTIPLRVASGISIEDQQAVQQRAIKKRLDLTNGKLVIEGVDEDAITYGLLKLYIKEWPFVHKNGSKVAITEANIKRLVGDAYQQLSQVIRAKEALVEKAVNGPFVEASEKP